MSNYTKRALTHKDLVKDFFDQIFSYENDTILKITIDCYSFRFTHPLYGYENFVHQEILCIHGFFEGVSVVKIDKEVSEEVNDKLLNYQKFVQFCEPYIFYKFLWKEFTIEPYYRINSKVLPLNNDICGLIEKKLGEIVTLVKKKFIIRINPYDYKNVELRVVGDTEFKTININKVKQYLDEIN
jgi:hypothetical protein